MKLELVLNFDTNGDGADLAALLAGVSVLLQAQQTVLQRQQSVSQEMPSAWHVVAVADVQAMPAPPKPQVIGITDLPAIEVSAHEPETSVQRSRRPKTQSHDEAIRRLAATTKRKRQQHVAPGPATIQPDPRKLVIPAAPVADLPQSTNGHHEPRRSL